MELQRHPSLVLDALIAVIAAVLIVAASKFGLEAGYPATKGAGSIIGGVYVLYLGVLFLLSYFFPSRCYLFKLLVYVASIAPVQPVVGWHGFILP